MGVAGGALIRSIVLGRVELLEVEHVVGDDHAVIVFSGDRVVVQLLERTDSELSISSRVYTFKKVM